MLELRYPPKSLTADWLRTLCGLGIGLGMLLFTPISWWTGIVFGSVSLLFLYFGRRTLEKQLQRVAIGDEGLWVRDMGERVVRWSALESLQLRFYGSRRQQRKLKAGEELSSGFMELTLRVGRTKVKFDSTLDGFSLLAWRAARAARDGGLKLDPASAGNLLDIGVDPDQDTAPPEMAQEWRSAIDQRAGERGEGA